MKKLLVLSIIIITACSPKDELPITQDEISITQNSISIKKDKSSIKDEKNLFYLTKETAVLLCGGKSRIIDSKNEEIIKIEVKDFSSAEKEKFVQFTLVETDRKGGKYRIVNCYPNKDPKKSVIKTIKTNYKLN
ncbi:hypothetical protein N9U92_00435 [Prochlorococcus sp. AH-736-L15]|nr:MULTISPECIES: hypothetical protein [unclassified Prochlorococcus]MDA9741103.1 hypothetical protein [Prochlorococcus sp. AH-736-L15]MDA9746758.1 hypothetical protein [Prochlorococcus sp. AH-736-M13]